MGPHYSITKLFFLTCDMFERSIINECFLWTRRGHAGEKAIMGTFVRGQGDLRAKRIEVNHLKTRS